MNAGRCESCHFESGAVYTLRDKTGERKRFLHTLHRSQRNIDRDRERGRSADSSRVFAICATLRQVPLCTLWKKTRVVLLCIIHRPDDDSLQQSAGNERSVSQSVGSSVRRGAARLAVILPTYCSDSKQRSPASMRAFTVRV